MSKKSTSSAALVLLTALTSCHTREVGAGSADGGTLIFSDDFERAELGDAWSRGIGEAGRGKWRIVDGRVVGRDLRNDPLWLESLRLPPRVRVEFDARAHTSVGDLKVEVFGDGKNHASGYVLIFGGWNNTLDVIARLDEHGKDRLSRKTKSVEQNRDYRMAVQRTGSTIEWYIDGELFMTYRDAQPLSGEQNAYFAFSNWAAEVSFDNVAVYALD